MLLGLDVGGTFTDIVLIDKGHIYKKAKRRTTPDNLMDGILNALDAVLVEVDSAQIERVTLSTTVITNCLVQGKEDKPDLYIVPGPGMHVINQLPSTPIVLKGYTNHQGEIKEHVSFPRVIEKGKQNVAAVSAKFSVRNPQEEERVAIYLREQGYDFVSEGAKLNGNLNFVRRTVSSYYNSAVLSTFNRFRLAVENALLERHITAPLYILKADGGSLSVNHMSVCPVESAFTGPAASVLGLKALGHISTKMTVALDIGGTTTDISLWRNGEPILARGGVNIGKYPSSVRSFAVKSVGIGGESAVRVTSSGNIEVGPQREGVAVALGGNVPTLSDALIVLGYANFGDKTKAYEALSDLCNVYNATRGQKNQISDVLDTINTAVENEVDMAERICKQAVETVVKGISEVVQITNRLPVYTVSDIAHPNIFEPEYIVVVGGTATALGPSIGKALALETFIPKAGEVINAIGAALSLETIHITARLNTCTRTLVIPECGIQEISDLQSIEELVTYAIEVLKGLIASSDYKGNADKLDFEVIQQEAFPIIKGWSTSGKIITVQVQVKAGVYYAN